MVNDAEDLVAAILEFENGVLGHLFAGPGETPEDASDGRPVTASTRSYMLYGTEGTIHSTPETLPEHHHFGRIMFAPTEKQPIDRSIPADAERWIHPAFEPIDTSGVGLPTVKPFVNEILHFEECIRTGTEPHQQRPGQHRDDEDHLWHLGVVPDGQGGGVGRPPIAPRGDDPKSSRDFAALVDRAQRLRIWLIARSSPCRHTHKRIYCGLYA